MLASEPKKRVLIVDDETAVRESLRLILSRLYTVEVAEDGGAALSTLERVLAETHSTEELPDLVLLDVMMPGLDGIKVLEEIRERCPKVPVIMLTATRAVRTAVQAMKIGAVDYLSKPFDVDELLSLIAETLIHGASGRISASEVTTFDLDRPQLPPTSGDFGALVGAHPLMQDVYRFIEQIAPRDTPVLITGESGTGKELVAREIHERSKRAGGPFIAINCAAIPETLIESEIFGHEKGAFTNAMERRPGYFELADKGTLFLDEIGELSLTVQVKILRFLQEQEFYRVGRSKPIRVDVRVLTATNRSLETVILEGKFRQDLFYRINVVHLDLPALRDRTSDISRLMDFFFGRFSALYGGRSIKLTAEAESMLVNYSWPGNVRELENVVESILALSNSDLIEPCHLPQRIVRATSNLVKVPSDLREEVLSGAMGFEEAEAAFEREIILRALAQTNNVQTKAAELLGISRRILKYKMDKLGI